MSYRQLFHSLKTGRFKRRSPLQFGLILLSVFSAVLISWVVMAQQPVTLRVLMPAPDSPPYQSLIKAFEEQNPGIRIEIVEGPNASNLVEDLYTSSFLLGDSPYDLINMDVVWTPKFAAAGWLMDLTDKVSQEDLTKFSPVDVEGSRYKDRLYRMPVRSDAGLLYYRKDLLAAAGLKPPETFDDLIQASKTLQESGKVPWGYVWQGRQYEGVVAMFVEVQKGFGGFWVNPDTNEVGLDRPETIQAINFLRQTIREGISPPGVTTYIEEDTRRFFQGGQAAFLRSWPYVWALANEDNSAIKGKVGIVPMVHAPGQESGACLGGWGMGIAKSTPHPEEAWKAVQFFTTYDPQKQFILETGYTPSLKQLFTEPEIANKYTHLPAMVEVINTAVLRPPIAQYAQASDILQRYLSAAFTDRMSAEDAMKQAAQETRQLLEAGTKTRA
jgi:multiple sugar transport system substrate-binding protein